MRTIVPASLLTLVLNVGLPHDLLAGLIDDAARVFDTCKREGGHSEEWCRTLVMSSNFETCYKKCGPKISCFDGCALKDHQATSVPWSLRGDRPRLAAEFIGLSDADLVKRFGPPVKVTTGNSPDGRFRMLVFSEQKGAETFFTVLDKDRVVSSGEYQGVAFDDPDYWEFARKCEQRFSGRLDAQATCSSRYRTKPKRK